jgi:histidinol-phosphate aminotransferase
MKVLSRRVRKFLKSGVLYPYSKAYGEEAKRYVNLSSNESPYGPSPKILATLKKEISRLSVYPDPTSRNLRERIANFLGVPPDCVLVGNGSDEIMDLAARAFLDEGERVFIPQPSFPIYEIVSHLYGGVPVPCRMTDFEWTEDMARKARGCRMAFIGRPNNPTGNIPPADLVEEIAGKVGMLLIDEAYIEFSDEKSLARWATENDNVLVLRTFSKAFGLAGLRVGYAVGSRKVVDILNMIRMPFNVNRLAQVAAAAALQDIGYMKKVVAKIKSEKERILKGLKALGLKPLPSQANFLMVDVSPWNMNAEKFCRLLMDKGILVRSLRNFKYAGERFVRITIGSPGQNQRLLKALRELEGEVG